MISGHDLKTLSTAPLQVMFVNFQFWLLFLFCRAPWPYRPACATCSFMGHSIITSDNPW